MRLGNVEVGAREPLFLIAGPCVIESAALCEEVAGRMVEITRALGIPYIFKASYDKANRSSRSSFRGPGIEAGVKVLEDVRAIVAAVRARGDAALREFAARFDGVAPERFAISPAEVDAALASLPANAIAALQRAIDNVRVFHAAQMPAPLVVETSPGVRCERIVRPIDAVGLYVPAGSAPLPSPSSIKVITVASNSCSIVNIVAPFRGQDQSSVNRAVAQADIFALQPRGRRDVCRGDCRVPVWSPGVRIGGVHSLAGASGCPLGRKLGSSGCEVMRSTG